MKTVPQAFYQTPNVQKIMVDGLSAIIYKEVETAALDNNRFVATPALTVVLEGALQITNYEGKQHFVNAGHMVLIPKGIYMISDILPNDKPFRALVFFFEERLIQQFLENFAALNKTDTNQQIEVFEQSEMLGIYLESLLNIYGEKNNASALTNLKLLELLHLIVQSDKAQGFVSALNNLDKRVRKNVAQFMQHNFDKPLSIEDYAYLTGRSISTFSRDFKRQFGQSPKQWLIEKRLEKAKEILLNDQLTVSQTALEVGYENLSHFIKAFHKKFGLSPKQYLIQKRKKLLI